MLFFLQTCGINHSLETVLKLFLNNKKEEKLWNALTELHSDIKINLHYKIHHPCSFYLSYLSYCMFIYVELKKVEGGGAKKVIPTVEAHHNRPQGVAVKVKIPQNEYPKVSFSVQTHIFIV